MEVRKPGPFDIKPDSNTGFSVNDRDDDDLEESMMVNDRCEDTGASN